MELRHCTEHRSDRSSISELGLSGGADLGIFGTGCGTGFHGFHGSGLALAPPLAPHSAFSLIVTHPTSRPI
jgi:hypothetical protein